MEEPHKQATMQRHTIFDRKACVADRDQVRRMWFVQRHTISQGKPCIASIRKEKKEDAMQRHTFSREKNLYREHGEEEKKRTEVTPHNAPPLHMTSTLQHYTTKAHPQKTGGRALLVCLRTD